MSYTCSKGLSNTIERTYPDGLDVEIMSIDALREAHKKAIAPFLREHVTPYNWRVPGRFRVGTLKAEKDYSKLRWTVDNEADFQLVSRIYEALYQEDKPFLMADILNYLVQHPELVKMNQDFIGKEGYREIWEPEKKRSSV